jgi:spore maturation protein A
LALHATSFTPLPSQTIALRQAAGAADPSDIVGPVALATAITAVLAAVLSKLFARLSRSPESRVPSPEARP